MFVKFILILAATISAAEVDPAKLVTAARSQVGVTVSYDPSYRKLDYPGGDVSLKTGVCSDVIIRALREQGVDLQKEVHEDMRRHFDSYPQNWGLTKPGRNIDHRRVTNLMMYFRRQGRALAVTDKAEDFAAGDIVAWDLGKGVSHVGIVSDRRGAKGTPLIIHNIGRGTQEENILFEYRIIAHFRLN